MEIIDRHDQTSQDYPRMGLNAAERTYISRQGNLFHKMRSQFVPQYQGLWVLFEDLNSTIIYGG